MLTVITRTPSSSIVNCELTYLDRAPIQFDLAQHQHDAYCQIIRDCGAEVVTLPAMDDFPDSVFVEDNAIIFDELAVLTLPGALSRRGEIARIAPEISKYRAVKSFTFPVTIEGGDVLKNGKKVYVGQSTRTNAAGLKALQGLLEPYGYTVIGVSVHGCLHLKTGCTFITPETMLINSEWVDTEVFKPYHQLEVDHSEIWSANALTINGTTLMTKNSPRTIEKVDRLGCPVVAVDISEFEKAEAGLTCMSLVI